MMIIKQNVFTILNKNSIIARVILLFYLPYNNDSLLLIFNVLIIITLPLIDQTFNLCF
jgi:hypothetical protein